MKEEEEMEETVEGGETTGGEMRGKEETPKGGEIREGETGEEKSGEIEEGETPPVGEEMGVGNKEDAKVLDHVCFLFIFSFIFSLLTIISRMNIKWTKRTRERRKGLGILLNNNYTNNYMASYMNNINSYNNNNYNNNNT